MDWAFLADCFLRIVPGIPTTLGLMSISVAAGLVLACLLALCRLSALPPLDWTARLFVFVFRGTPLAIQMFLIYFGLAQFPAIRASLVWPYLREPFWCAFLALSLNTAAYGSEIVRGALLSVPFGQTEAARACGMSGAKLFWRITLPIALRQALPSYSNEVILMVKATSLASMVTLVEVTGLAARIISETFRVFEVFAVAALIYLAINFTIARLVAALEWWLSPHLRDAPATLRAPVLGGSALSTPALEIRDLRKRFGPLEVLRGISLSAQKGEAIAILGASGSGKSTLLRCCNLLEMPDGGDVVVDGEAFAFKDRRGQRVAADRAQVDRLRGELGFVFQNFCLWSHMTVLENVIEAPIHVQGRPRAEAVEEAEALLAKVGIADKRHHYPAHLSGGQQQRAAIARALAIRPKVLLFDEPTSALDPELVGEVLGVIRALALEGRTMLIVTHEMNFARDVAARVVFLHQGQVDCEGPPEAMFTAPPTERFASFIARATRG